MPELQPASTPADWAKMAYRQKLAEWQRLAGWQQANANSIAAAAYRKKLAQYRQRKTK